MKNDKIKKLALSGMFMALGYVIPFMTGQIPEIGNMLCPMHIPIILCGYVCGASYGLTVGFITPLLRSLTLGMPPLFPTAVAMAFELAIYGFASGILYKNLRSKKWAIYFSLILSMILGRLAWGFVTLCCMGFDITKFTFSAFWAGAVSNAIPGIIIQLVLIPIVIILLEKGKIIKK